MRKSIRAAKVFALSAVLIIVSTAAFSEEYRSEVSIIHERTDFEHGGRSLDNGVSASFFLSPVKTGDHPYAEAAFLEKIGGVSLIAGQTDFKGGSLLEGDGPFFSANLSYTTPDFPLVITPLFAISSTDYTDSSLKSADSSSYGIGIGKFLSYGLLATVAYSHAKISYDYNSAPDDDSDYDLYSLTVKYVKETGNGRALNMFAGVQRMQYDNRFSSGNIYPFFAAADYYFTRGLSAGVGINVVNDQATDGKTYSANIRNFFTPALSLQISYDRYLDDESGDGDDRSFMVTAAARF